ncbi:hypothetical protein [Bradyrhizobium sp. SZCCHNR2028]|uniref:hypothetical protein n=1 Tax=Bradyrhizobium sp. SZCCHNR2028 TaxID=3057382 RepID=UPI0028EAB6F1|nr:hypothetical protein [Bradyrhizobium sp. SZCCHNR2028]
MSSYYLKKFDLAAKPKTTHLFLAEGEAEVGLVDQYLNQIGADFETTSILCFRGLTKAATFVPTLAKLMEKGATGLDQLRGIGMLADSENDPVARLNMAIQFGVALAFPSCSGDIRDLGRHESRNRRFAVSLSPANDKVGRIENLVLAEVANDDVFKCVEQSFACIAAANGTEVDEKAKVQMFISAKINSSMAGIQHAFAKGIFQCAAPVYDPVRSMLDYILAA